MNAMQGVDEALLRPSLSGAGAGVRAPYSTQMGMLASFFGGPFSALAVVGLNAWRLQRLRAEALPLALLAVLTIGLDVGLMLRPTLVLPVAQWLDTPAGNALHLLVRALSLVVFAAGLLLHRQHQRAADLLGLDRPRGLWVGLGLIVGGFALQLLIGVALQGLHR